MFIKKTFLSCLLLGAATLTSLTSCNDQEGSGGLTSLFSSAPPADPVEIRELADLAGKKAGYLEGGVFPHLLKTLQPDIAEFQAFHYTQFMVQALRKGKIDAVLEDEPIALLWAAYYPEDLHVAFNYADDSYAFATCKGNPLSERLSAVIQQLEQSGELERFKEKWCKSIDQNRRITKWNHKKDYDGSAGTIRYATDPTQVPMAYMAYNELMGMDIEVINRVAYELNMKVEYIKKDFAELLDAVQNNQVDLVGGCLSITPKRKDRVDFTYPYYKGGMAVLVRNARKKEAPKAE